MTNEFTRLLFSLETYRCQRCQIASFARLYQGKCVVCLSEIDPMKAMAAALTNHLQDVAISDVITTLTELYAKDN